MESKQKIGKLSRDQMMTLLQACYDEQRAPTLNELHVSEPKRCEVTYATERRGGGLFDLLDDDALAEVLSRLPMQQRIVFAKRLCKQFAGVAHEHKAFEALCVSPVWHVEDTEAEANNSLRAVDNWGFLTKPETQLRELKLREGRGSTIEVPPPDHLRRLAKLSLINVRAATLKRVRQIVDASGLKELHVVSTKATNDLVALLKQSTSLERLSICDTPNFDMAKVVDAWREVHRGCPPLRFLKVTTIGCDVRNLERLDIDEIHCHHVHVKIGTAHLPSVRALSVHVYNDAAETRIPSLKTLVASCPGLQTLTLKRWKTSRAHDIAIVADAMKKEFPLLSVHTVVLSPARG